MSSFYDLVLERRSIRSYSSKPVPLEDVEDVIRTALEAPSAKNLQPWEIIIVQDEKRRKRLAEIAGRQEFVGEAPIILAPVATEPERVMTCDIPAYAVDLSILVTHMMLRAAEKGLGTCWIGAFDSQEAADELGVPAGRKVFTLLPLGYPAKKPERRPRKDFDDVVSWEQYGQNRQEDA